MMTQETQEIRCAPPYLGTEDVGQFLVERRRLASGPLPVQVIVWAFREPILLDMGEGPYTAYRVLDDSSAWVVDEGIEVEGPRYSRTIAASQGRWVE